MVHIAVAIGWQKKKCRSWTVILLIGLSRLSSVTGSSQLCRLLCVGKPKFVNLGLVTAVTVVELLHSEL